MFALGRVIANMNGVLVAYTMGFVNAVLVMLMSFGLNLTDQQIGSILAVTNALLVLVAHAAHANAKHTKAVIPSGPVNESAATSNGQD